MNPLDLIYGWQAFLLALLASCCTELVKRIIDYVLADSHENLPQAMREGADERRLHLGLTQGLMPIVPLAAGAFLALIAPRPEALDVFAATLPPGLFEHGAVMAWGAYAGALGDYLYGRFREPLKALRNYRAG